MAVLDVLVVQRFGVGLVIERSLVRSTPGHTASLAESEAAVSELGSCLEAYLGSQSLILPWHRYQTPIELISCRYHITGFLWLLSLLCSMPHYGEYTPS